MLFITKPKPKVGDKRWVTSFAVLPVKFLDVGYIWMEHYMYEQEYVEEAYYDGYDPFDNRERKQWVWRNTGQIRRGKNWRRQ